MIETIEYKGHEYPALQASGFASRFAFPFAQEILKDGIIYDIGFNREDWKFPNAIGIDINNSNGYHAMNLPDGLCDGIFSSHFLEHYEGRFQDVIEYWMTKVKSKGVIFLYLPNCENQKYWAWGNKKHIHYLSPKIMQEYCENIEGISYFVTEGFDLNSSFYCIIETR